MGIGVSILLIAAGLILALAVDVQLSGLDLDVVGWILVLAGVIGLILTMVIWGPRRTPPPVAGRGEYVEERRTYEDPPRY